MFLIHVNGSGAIAMGVKHRRRLQDSGACTAEPLEPRCLLTFAASLSGPIQAVQQPVGQFRNFQFRCG